MQNPLWQSAKYRVGGRVIIYKIHTPQLGNSNAKADKTEHFEGHSVNERFMGHVTKFCAVCQSGASNCMLSLSADHSMLFMRHHFRFELHTTSLIYMHTIFWSQWNHSDTPFMDGQ